MIIDFNDIFGKADINTGKVSISAMGFKYEVKENTVVVNIPINPEADKKDVRVKLLRPGLLEIKWPRNKKKGEEIQVE